MNYINLLVILVVVVFTLCYIFKPHRELFNTDYSSVKFCYDIQNPEECRRNKFCVYRDNICQEYDCYSDYYNNGLYNGNCPQDKCSLINENEYCEDKYMQDQCGMYDTDRNTCIAKPHCNWNDYGDGSGYCNDIQCNEFYSKDSCPADRCVWKSENDMNFPPMPEMGTPGMNFPPMPEMGPPGMTEQGICQRLECHRFKSKDTCNTNMCDWKVDNNIVFMDSVNRKRCELDYFKDINQNASAPPQGENVQTTYTEEEEVEEPPTDLSQNFKRKMIAMPYVKGGLCQRLKTLGKNVECSSDPLDPSDAYVDLDRELNSVKPEYESLSHNVKIQGNNQYMTYAPPPPTDYSAGISGSNFYLNGAPPPLEYSPGMSGTLEGTPPPPMPPNFSSDMSSTYR